MTFLEPYLLALRDQAPRVFMEMRRNGTLQDHLLAKVNEAEELYAQLTRGAPRLPSGLVRQPYHREAEERVRSELIVFPDHGSNNGAL